MLPFWMAMSVSLTAVKPELLRDDPETSNTETSVWFICVALIQQVLITWTACAHAVTPSH